MKAADRLRLDKICPQLLKSDRNTQYMWIETGDYVFEAEVVLCRVTHKSTGTEAQYRTPVGQYYDPDVVAH